MEYISTSAVAKKLDIKSPALFELLKVRGWISKKNDEWILTDIGKENGGQSKYNPKFGNYIVWPETIQIGEPPIKDNKFLNATAIGQHFNITSQRLNLLLNELGLIEKTIAGWGITKLGKKIGGLQREHVTSGNTYISWPEAILMNKDILEMFMTVSPTDTTITAALLDNSLNQLNETSSDFRKKYPAEYRTKDGHYVRSKAELTIDDSLYLWGIPHAYEKKIPNTEENVYSDFHIPSGKGRTRAVYIEYWGMENDEKYNSRKSKKIEIYESLGLNLIQLNDNDIKNIEDSLQKYLLQHGIKVSLD